MSRTGSRDVAAAARALLVAGLLSLAAVVALGRPDASSAVDFLSTGRPTHDEAVATIELVVWALVAALVVLQVMSAMRRSLGVAEQVRRRGARARVALTMGLLVFCGGALHHQANPGAICCGDVGRAGRLAR